MRCCQSRINLIFSDTAQHFQKYTPSSSALLIVDNDAPLLAVGYADTVAQDILRFVNYH